MSVFPDFVKFFISVDDFHVSVALASRRTIAVKKKLFIYSI